MNGEYPKTMQDIVGERLPKFTKEQAQMVKGSMDFIGINQYSAYYIFEPHNNPQPNKDLGYQQDWNVGYACKCLFFKTLFFREYLAYILKFTTINSYCNV